MRPAGRRLPGTGLQHLAILRHNRLDLSAVHHHAGLALLHDTVLKQVRSAAAVLSTLHAAHFLAGGCDQNDTL